MLPIGTVEHKIINSVANVDKTAKKVVVEISSMDDIDQSNDTFLPTAWNRTIVDRGPKGSDEIWHLLDHEDSIREGALSKPDEIYVKNNKLIFVTPYRDTYNWRECAWAMYEGGDINQHSAGFIALKSHKEYSGSKQIRVIEEALLMEGSAVLWGDNKNTKTQAVLKSWLAKREKKAAIPERLSKIYDAIRGGEYAGENLSLLRLELKYLEQAFYELEKKANLTPDEPEIGTGPDEVEKMRLAAILKAVKDINSQFQIN
jgi:phage head maturation protease